MKRLQRNNLVPSLTSSAATTPPFTPKSSNYPSEDEDGDDDDEMDDEGRSKKAKHFRFLDLPSELRNKIYGYVFYDAPNVLDLDPDNFRLIYRKIAIFLVCRQISGEASHYFYSTRAIRLFPTYPGKFFKSKRPLLARLSPRNRAAISTFQLRLGPGGWNKPPRGWIVNDALGLKDAVNCRILKCFVEVDPTDGIWKGFRSNINYERFCRDLLKEILAEVPSIIEVQFDAWSSVQKNGDLMCELIGVAVQQKKMVSWGPERGWTNDDDTDVKAIVKEMGDMVLSKGANSTVPRAATVRA